ncbi:hypothetical protein T02_15232 [Trichinella nativa]|uniref:Uncharacterized protein n=1 Tax=Trichinella nativa TaxID=6335 RepID=A0A0V1LH56_9BILA|nr:hypothetical protein T02_15232 [Trichinella nativa]
MSDKQKKRILRKKVFAVFQKKAYGMYNFREKRWNPKMDFKGNNRSEMNREVQQTYPRSY